MIKKIEKLLGKLKKEGKNKNLVSYMKNDIKLWVSYIAFLLIVFFCVHFFLV